MRAMTLVSVGMAALIYGSAAFEFGFRMGARAVIPATFAERFGAWGYRLYQSPPDFPQPSPWNQRMDA
jgi:hypothetical protein